MEVGQAFNGMLLLVREISMYYSAKAVGMQSSQASVDFISLFGAQIEHFYYHRKLITDEMWKHQLGEDESMDIATISAWLSPRDSVLKKLHKDRVLTPEHRDEYTCEWFQRHLLDFSRSQDDVLALVGREGCGKTYLFRWIVERLQRPIGKKSRKFTSHDTRTQQDPMYSTKARFTAGHNQFSTSSFR